MEIVTNDLANALVQEGIKVSIVTTSFKKDQDRNITINSNNCIIYSLKDTKPMKYSRSWWSMSKKFYRKLKANEPIDILFSVSAAGYAIAKQKDNPPIIFQAHGTSLGEIKTKIRLDWKSKLKSLKNVYGLIQDIFLLRRFDLIITIGSKVFNDISSQRFFRDVKKLNIDNAVDTELFKFNPVWRDEIRNTLNISQNAKVFISSSRIHAEKGILESIEIFENVFKQDSTVRFIIVGDGPEKGKMLDYVKEKKLDEQIYFIGKVDRHQLAQYYSASDYLLFTTLREEGLPLSLLEALSASLVCFVSEKLKLNIDAPTFTISPKNVELSSKIILDVIGNSKIDVLKEQGNKIILSHYSKEVWVKKYIDTFNSFSKEKVHAN
ncbi:glycosyltransferase family 4 protein [Paenibacillus shunpengii]|uniref:Glycosyltransferase family 4 protein n=1 Tax=Paenibacillus shunpengii TaxID=2054424 RepID=A0ABW5SL53_9BACL